MYESMERCIELINNNGGFTVVGWYKRGVINDKSMITTNANANTSNNPSLNNNDDVQIDSGDISYHIVHISPTDKNFLESTSVLGTRLNALKFDVTSIETNNS